MCDSSGSSGDQNANKNLDNEVLVPAVSDGNEDSWGLNSQPFILHSCKELVYILSISGDFERGKI
jgi:hypothetical protein